MGTFEFKIGQYKISLETDETETNQEINEILKDSYERVQQESHTEETINRFMCIDLASRIVESGRSEKKFLELLNKLLSELENKNSAEPGDEGPAEI